MNSIDHIRAPARSMQRGVAVMAGCAAFCLQMTASTAAFGDDIILSPHRAVYNITLDKSTAGSTIANLNGRMIYDLAGDPCQGYTQKVRFVLHATNQDGAAQLNDLRTETWERVASRAFKFHVESYIDEMLTEETQGAVTAEKVQDGITVDLEKPSAKSVELAQGTLFPMAHSVAVLRAAKSGKTVFATKLYDGSEDGETVFDTTAMIGKRLPGVGEAVVGAKDSAAVGLAKQSDSWPVSMSYYNTKKLDPDGRPTFEMSYRFHLTGVTSRFVIDHGDFAFRGTLTQLEMTDPPGCDAKPEKTSADQAGAVGQGQ